MIRLRRYGNGKNHTGYVDEATLYTLQWKTEPTYEDEPDLCTAIEFLDPFQYLDGSA